MQLSLVYIVKVERKTGGILEGAEGLERRSGVDTTKTHCIHVCNFQKTN